MSIADVMTVQVVSVEPETNVGDAIRRMADAGIGALAVCEGSTIVGIFTERDVLHLAGGTSDFTARPVRAVMTPRPIVAAPDDEIIGVADLMRERKIRHMPVVEDGRLLGMVSARDVMAALVERLWRSHDEHAHDTARALLRRSG